MSEPTTIDVYPVGVLADFRLAYRSATRLHRWDLARNYLRRIPRYPMGCARRRDWRAFKNSFNGYLAEVAYPPAGLNFHTCGHGWTKRRAVRRLGEYLARDNAGSRPAVKS